MVRRIPWKTLAIGGAVAGGLGVLAIATRKPVPTPARRVALIGDSYAVGLGPELAKLLPNVKYAGVVGTNTSQWAAHSTACGSCGDWLTTFKPDVVLVSLGVNDGTVPNAANYQTIVRGLHGLGARVVWIEPPASVRTPSRNVISSLGVATVLAPTLPMANSLHPTPAGYAQWAQEISTTVSR